MCTVAPFIDCILIFRYDGIEDTESNNNAEKGRIDYTTWKIRECGEQKYILDYIFSSGLKPVSVLEMPQENQIGEGRLPSLKFPSDDLTLVADMVFN